MQIFFDIENAPDDRKTRLEQKKKIKFEPKKV